MLNEMERAADMEADKIDEVKDFVFHECKDKTVNALINDLSSRAVSSNIKHGNTINEVDKSIPEWITEAKEESMDMAVYLQRLEAVVETARALLVDLGWESQRMSSSGTESLTELWKLFNIETDEEIANEQNV